METVDATIVFLPRFTTLVGNVSAGQTYDFPTLPLDVSRFTGVQFQIWHGPTSAGTLKVFLEESLDCQTWVLGPNTPEGIDLVETTRFCSYNFRLRWFRLRIQLKEVGIVTCWAEGLLRGGGAGLWPLPPSAAPSSATTASPIPGAVDLGLVYDSKTIQDMTGAGRLVDLPVEPIRLPKGAP